MSLDGEVPGVIIVELGNELPGLGGVMCSEPSGGRLTVLAASE